MQKCWSFAGKKTNQCTEEDRSVSGFTLRLLETWKGRQEQHPPTFPLISAQKKRGLSSQLIYTSRHVYNNDRQHKGLHVPPYVGLQYLKKTACFWHGDANACQLNFLGISVLCEHHVIKDDMSSTNSINNRTHACHLNLGWQHLRNVSPCNLFSYVFCHLLLKLSPVSEMSPAVSLGETVSLITADI